MKDDELVIMTSHHNVSVGESHDGTREVWSESFDKLASMLGQQE